MKMTRYAVSVDGQQITVNAWGVFTAAAFALVQLGVRVARQVVVQGQSEHATFQGARGDECGLLSWSAKSG